ncbi:hypothetical protein N7492_001342 [Penicillium capsulatum]|uniref:Clr5 domain-containing protein n=1 Tax=Penicillium capsulatum TaxID=69766 RepID=A0A9W9IUI0_9EURO|nr:hypothetical protein N7492_001342 [Penicillium capsulatum]KAJ6129599.1 hypothetical protein N7512_002379 [Penicillium capsulatum]
MDPFPSTLSPQPPSNVFRPRRSDDWHKYRETIESLYRDPRLKLRNVKSIMEEEHNFYASEKQYKDRLAAWNIRKNIKAKEVHLMIRKKKKRAAKGKQTAFRVNGQDVDPKRIARFVRRYGSSWEHDEDQTKEQTPEPSASIVTPARASPLIPSIETPSDMTCYTPERVEDIGTPVSPPDIQSPSREPTAYPLNYDPNQIDTFPDLIMDDDHSYMHSSTPRRAYNPPEPIHHVSMPGTAVPMAPAPASGPAHHSRELDATGNMMPPAAGWSQLDAFQTRLESLQNTLNQSMSKWAREQDPNQEISHHEGLGM